MMLLDRKVFYDRVRADIFGGRLAEGQFRGLEAILDEWRRRALPDLRQLAYILATAFHETGGKMLPVEENLNYTSAQRICKVWPTRFAGPAAAKAYVGNPQALAEKVYGGRGDLGNSVPGDGWRFRGRGCVQITGRRNYATFARRLEIDLVVDPDQASEPGIAVAILCDGMLDGVFTGAKLADYIAGERCDWRNARRVVNGLDRADEIARHSEAFHSAIAEAAEARGQWTDRPVAPRTPDAERPPAGSPAPSGGNLMPMLLGGLVAAALAAGALFFFLQS